MALSAPIIWRVFGGTGASTNGGGFNPSATGTDWSNQAAAQYSLTGLTTAGAAALIATTAASADMVGNVLHVNSGTNFTVGFYEILSVVVGVSITVDRNATTGVGAAGAAAVGGALDTLGRITAAVVAGNTIGFKGSYTTTAAETFGNIGTTTAPFRIIGYTTTIGDGYLGRTNSNGPLITTNFPTITYTSTGRLTVGSMAILETINITSAASTGTLNLTGSDNTVRAWNVTNSANNAASVACIAATAEILDCDMACTNATTGALAVLNMTAANNVVKGGRFTATSTGVPVVALGAGSPSAGISDATIFGGATGVSVTTTSGRVALDGCTIAGTAGDGVSIIASSTVRHVVANCCITDNGGYGVNPNGGAVAVSNTRFRDNTSGAINASAWTTATNYGAVTTGAGTSDYTNAAGGNYSLIATSPAVNAALPSFASMGALQRSQTGSGGYSRGRVT